MDLSKKLLSLLAIFCVIASAGVACAADVGSGDGVIDGYAGMQYGAAADDAVLEDGITQDDAAGADTLEPGNGLPLENQTGPVGNTTSNAVGNATGNATGNSTGHAAGEPTNTTGNATANHSMPATGNPILALFAVTAVLGGYAALRRK